MIPTVCPSYGGADADIALIGQPFQTHKTGKAACSVAALRHFTAFSIENAIVKIQFRIIRRLNLIGENSNFDISQREGEIAYWIGVPYQAVVIKNRELNH